ncbi:MAG: hypothetical protein AMJ81_11770 [Phycisphaerae bacterium SM23_33]|nr:MAG: hypothetical protein AMJ81_11770 [Phycisphaerae bacterium SM23_33]
MSYSRGRLRISLNQVSTVVFFGALLVLLLLAFILGRQSGLAAASADPGEVRSGLDQGATTQPHVTPHPGPEPTSQGVRLSEMVPDDYSRPKGLQYLVIQDLVWTRQEAEDIKGFLYSHGINATIERMGRTRTYRIRDTKGFQSDRSEEAKEYKAQIERLGKEYRRRGRYDFVGAWFKPEL